MSLTLTAPQKSTTNDLNLDGYFDGAIGLKPQSQDERYLEGYYQGLAKYLDW